MLATGSAKASMAPGGGDDGGLGGGVHVDSFGGHYGSGRGFHVGRFFSRTLSPGLRGNPGYYDPWRDYGTDGACSFDVVTARYVEPDGIWHYCP